MQGATFDAEEEEDSELREVLPAWDAAELDAELSFSGSEPSSSEEGEEEEIAQEVCCVVEDAPGLVGLSWLRSWVLWGRARVRLAAAGCVAARMWLPVLRILPAAGRSGGGRRA